MASYDLQWNRFLKIYNNLKLFTPYYLWSASAKRIMLLWRQIWRFHKSNIEHFDEQHVYIREESLAEKSTTRKVQLVSTQECFNYLMTSFFIHIFFYWHLYTLTLKQMFSGKGIWLIWKRRPAGKFIFKNMSPPLSVIDIHHERKINIQMDVDGDLVWFFPRKIDTTEGRL